MNENRIKEVMANILGITVDTIDENSSPDTIENWDSLRQMNLILALEEEFQIKFKDDQIVEMLNYKLIKFFVSENMNSK